MSSNNSSSSTRRRISNADQTESSIIKVRPSNLPGSSTSPYTSADAGDGSSYTSSSSAATAATAGLGAGPVSGSVAQFSPGRLATIPQVPSIPPSRTNTPQIGGHMDIDNLDALGRPGGKLRYIA